MTNKKPIISMTHHGPVEDIAPSGYQDCTGALVECMQEILGNIQDHKDAIFNVLVTDIKTYYDKHGDVVDSDRIEKNRIRTFRRLEKVRKRAYNEDFSPESLADKIEKQDRKMEALHRQGQARAGWGLYTQCMSIQRAIEDEKIFEDSIRNEPEDRKRSLREQIKQENSKKGGMMYIG